METPRFVVSPVCQIPKRTVTALEQASVDELLEPGAFTAMGHLAVSGVLVDALGYASQLADSVGVSDPFEADSGMLPGARLLAADASFLSQVFGLVAMGATEGIVGGATGDDDEGESHGPTLADIVEDARSLLVKRIASWHKEPGRHSARFKVQEGDGGVVWPSYVWPVSEDEPKFDPKGDPDALALFGALPLLAPFMALEEDCFVAPRLE